MFKKALAGVHEIDARHGRTPDEGSSRAAGALTAAAVGGNLKHIDQVVLGTDAKHMFAVEGDPRSVHHNSVSVPTQLAMQQPLDASTALVDGKTQAQAPQPDQQLALQQNETTQRSRSMG
ncbi:MAG: XVIPCD domain-containing protein [Lysobacter sp.]